MQDEALKTLISWVLTGGGSGVIAYFLLERWTWAQGQLNDEMKRWLAFAMAGVLALGFWGIEIAMQFVEAPVDWRAAISQAVSILTVAFTSSQMLHARVRQARIHRMKMEQLRG